MVQCFLDSGATWANRSTDQVEAEALFEARRLAYPALERLGPVLTEDVCVPKAQVPEMLARIDRIAREHRITIANIAHAGDGNMHPVVAFAKPFRIPDFFLLSGLFVGRVIDRDWRLFSDRRVVHFA